MNTKLILTTMIAALCFMGCAGGNESNGSGTDKNKTNDTPAAATLTIADFCAKHAKDCDNGYTVEECVSHYTKYYGDNSAACTNAIMTQRDCLWATVGITKACAQNPYKEDSPEPVYEKCTAETDVMNAACK